MDILESEIPLLMSRTIMKKMKMVIDLKDDTALVEGKKVNLITTKSSIYVMPLGYEENVTTKSTKRKDVTTRGNTKPWNTSRDTKMENIITKSMKKKNVMTRWKT